MVGSTTVGAMEFAYEMDEWEGTPTELFELLSDQVGRGVARSSAWPKSIQYFVNAVRRLVPQLRMGSICR